MKYKDYYKTLGLERGASQDDIKKAYRRLARKYHPDVSKEKNAEERFKEIGEAYEVLKDPEKRAAYDQLGQHRPGEEFRPPPDWGEQYRGRAGGGFNAGEGVAGFGGFGTGGGGAEFDMSDLFEQLFGGGRGAREGGRARGANFSAPGQDYEVVVHLTLEEAYRGTEVNLNLTVPEYDERGAMKRVPKNITVRIPKGVTDGQKLRVPGKGGPGMNGGPPGALYLDIVLRPHPLFKPSGHDLYLEVPIAPWEAALGAAIEVPALEGRVRLKIAPGARAGQRLRLAGKGLPKQDGGYGDMYAILQIVTPTVLSPREKELFEEMQRISTFNPRGHFEAR